MWEKIESYIKNHRGELDMHEPSDRLWENIESGLNSDSDEEGGEGTVVRPMFYRMMRIAATIAVLTGLSILLVNYLPLKNASILSGNLNSAVHGVDSEQNLESIQVEYLPLLEEKQMQLEALPTEETAEFIELTTRLRTLEKENRQLLDGIRNGELTPESRESLIENYQQQLELYEEMLATANR